MTKTVQLIKYCTFLLAQKSSILWYLLTDSSDKSRTGTLGVGTRNRYQNVLLNVYLIYYGEREQSEKKSL